MQNLAVTHVTPVNDELASMLFGFDHFPPAYVNASPFASTATQNEALAHEIATGVPEGSIEVAFDHDPLP